MPAQLEGLKTGQMEKDCCEISVVPDDLPRLWDKIEYNRLQSMISKLVDEFE